MATLQTPMHVAKAHARGLNGSPAACGAKTRSGGSCQNPAMPNGRCRMHGGKNLYSGPASPAFKHGGRSTWLKNLPRDLSEAAEQSIQQGSEIAQDDSIAALDALLDETTSMMDRGGSWGLWVALQNAANGVRALRHKAEGLRSKADTTRDGDDESKATEAENEYEDALQMLFTLIDEGAEDAGLKRQMVTLLEQRRKHTETEIKRRTAAFASMQASQVMEIIRTLLEVALPAIPTPTERAAVLRVIESKLPRLGVASDAPAR